MLSILRVIKGALRGALVRAACDIASNPFDVCIAADQLDSVLAGVHSDLRLMSRLLSVECIDCLQTERYRCIPFRVQAVWCDHSMLSETSLATLVLALQMRDVASAAKACSSVAAAAAVSLRLLVSRTYSASNWAPSSRQAYAVQRRHSIAPALVVQSVRPLRARPTCLAGRFRATAAVACALQQAHMRCAPLRPSSRSQDASCRCRSNARSSDVGRPLDEK